MRCNKARKLLTEGNSGDSALLKHLENCPECREVADASREVQALLIGARKDLPVVALANVRRQVEARAGRQSRWELIMSRFVNRTSEHRRMIAGVGFTLIVLLFVTMFPFSYTGVTGYEITLSDGTDEVLSPQLLTVAMAVVGHEDVFVADGALPGQYIFSGLSSRQEANDIAAALAALSGTEDTPTVEPVLGKMSWTIYAQAVRKIVSDDDGPIRIRLKDGRFVLSDSSLREALLSTGADESKVEKVIRDYISEKGGVVSDLIITADVDEGRRIKIVREGDGTDGDQADQDVQARVVNGDWSLRFRVSDTAGDSGSSLEVLSGDDLDSLSDVLNRGIILEFPGGSEAGQEALMIRLHVVPRE